MPHVPRVVLYFKPQCARCEQARDVLERVRPYHMFDLEEVNVNLDPVAFGLYSDKLPVVSVNGQPAFRHGLDEDRLIRRLRLARQEMAREEEERRKAQARAHPR